MHVGAQVRGTSWALQLSMAQENLGNDRGESRKGKLWAQLPCETPKRSGEESVFRLHADRKMQVKK